MSEIILENLTKTYHVKSDRQTQGKGTDILALDHLSCRIGDGEFVAVTGPSGCGKTTLLRMISGLDQPTSGKIFIDGRCTDDMPPAERKVAMVFQEYALYPRMTAFENMAFPLINRKEIISNIRKQVYHVADLLDIRYLLNRRPKNMSWGQRQRVSLGRAICSQPSIMLMDEPLSGADEELRRELMDTIRDLHQEYGFTCLYVTHKPEEAASVADRILRMNNGRIAGFSGTNECWASADTPLLHSAPRFDPVTGKMLLEEETSEGDV